MVIIQKEILSVMSIRFDDWNAWQDTSYLGIACFLRAGVAEASVVQPMSNFIVFQYGTYSFMYIKYKFL